MPGTAVFNSYVFWIEFLLKKQTKKKAHFEIVLPSSSFHRFFHTTLVLVLTHLLFSPSPFILIPLTPAMSRSSFIGYLLYSFLQLHFDWVAH